MKISTSKTELQSALQKLSKAIPARSTLPILSSVLFNVEESGTVLRTTDLEITIIVNLPVSVESSGSVALPLQTLLDITNELPNDARMTLAAFLFTDMLWPCHRPRRRTAARSAHPHALQAPSAAHHALPVSGQSSVVHVPLCRCVSCALCENLRAPN